MFGEELRQVLVSRLGQHRQVAPVDDLNVRSRGRRRLYNGPKLVVHLRGAASDVEGLNRRAVLDDLDAPESINSGDVGG